MVILRVHTNVKAILQQQKAMEFNWRQVWDEDNSTDMMTLMMPYMLYNIKHSCGPDQSVCLQFDFRRKQGEMSESKAVEVDDDNIDRLSNLLLDQYRKKAALYKHNVVLVPLGDDFRFDFLGEWDQQYKNYMKLFDHMNSNNKNVHVRFGTLQDYFDEVQKVVVATGKNSFEYFPALSGDFFPYTDHSDEYWTGYFSTRPFIKGLSRDLEVFLRAADILNAHCMTLQPDLKDLYNFNASKLHLTTAHRHLALFQHHDAITGTAQIGVAVDYANRLYQGLGAAKEVLKSAVGSLFGLQSSTPISLRVLDPPGTRMVSPDDHVIHIPENGIKIILFNPIAQPRKELVKLMIDYDLVEIVDDKGNAIPCQLTNNFNKILINYELAFLADLPSLGIVPFSIKRVKKPVFSHVSSLVILNNESGSKSLTDDDEIFIENDFMLVKVSTYSGQIIALHLKKGDIDLKMKAQFLLYASRRSGAYIFGPAHAATRSQFTKKPLIRVLTGPVFSEIEIIHQLVTQKIRLVNCSTAFGTAIAIDTIVNMTRSDERELIMRFITNVHSGDVFYTDQNGFHTMERKRFSRFPIEANFYPSTSTTFIEDEKTRLTLVMSQPFGVSSQESGSFEVMLDRRLRYDDNRGLGSGVQDNKITASRFYLVIEQRNMQSAKTSKTGTPLALPSLFVNMLVDRLRNFPMMMVSNFHGPLNPYEVVNNRLPCDVVLVNFRYFGDQSKEAVLLLHKVGFSDKYHRPDVSAVSCTEPAEHHQIVLSKLLQNSSVRRITETSLSLMHDKGRISYNETISLKSMELYAFKLLFN